MGGALPEKRPYPEARAVRSDDVVADVGEENGECVARTRRRARRRSISRGRVRNVIAGEKISVDRKIKGATVRP